MSMGCFSSHTAVDVSARPSVVQHPRAAARAPSSATTGSFHVGTASDEFNHVLQFALVVGVEKLTPLVLEVVVPFCFFSNEKRENGRIHSVPMAWQGKERRGGGE